MAFDDFSKDKQDWDMPKTQSNNTQQDNPTSGWLVVSTHLVGIIIPPRL